MHETVALLALVALIVVAVRRPRGLPEVVTAVPAVVLVIATGAVSWADARHEVDRLGPVVGFLAAVLVIADCCAAEGVFRVAGTRLADRAGRSSSRLLLGVAVLASVTTALLSLDTTVVLLTPVVVATVRANRASPRPPLYATAHLANSASLLMPVSNLTNLLAFAVVPVSFVRFTALMAMPWLVAVLVEIAAVGAVFRTDLSRSLTDAAAEIEPVPRFATTVVVLTVLGFGVTSPFGLAPVWIATAGASVLAGYRLMRRRTSLRRVAGSTAPSFCLFVLGLGIVVRAVSANGLGDVVRHVVPAGGGFLSLLGVAALAALISNLINNLPATLLLLPIVAVGGVGPVLAMLIGVDIGPNLSYPGSLATLLWRRAVADVDDVPNLRVFTRLGILTVPAAIGLSTAALWLSLRLVGSG